MILKARHLYRGDYKYKDRYIGKDGVFGEYRGYVIICPIEDIDTDELDRHVVNVKSYVHIDVCNHFNEDSCIYLGYDWEFKNASVGDILEIIWNMKKYKNNGYRYNVKTNEICLK